MPRLLLKILAASLCGGLSFIAGAAASDHAFSTRNVATLMFNLLHMEPLVPGERGSVTVDGRQIVIKYEGVEALAGTNRYAVVFVLE